MKSVWQWTLLWPVIIDKAIMQHYYYYLRILFSLFILLLLSICKLTL